MGGLCATLVGLRCVGQKKICAAARVFDVVAKLAPNLDTGMWRLNMIAREFDRVIVYGHVS